MTEEQIKKIYGVLYNLGYVGILNAEQLEELSEELKEI